MLKRGWQPRSSPLPHLPKTTPNDPPNAAPENASPNDSPERLPERHPNITLKAPP